MKLALCLVLSVLFALPLVADNCAAPVVKKVVVQHQAAQYVAPHANNYAAPVATLVAPYVQTIAVQPVLLPIYSAVYQPAPVQEQRHESSLELKELLNEIRGLRSEVESLKHKSPRQELRAPTANLLATKCAACHSPDNADDKGDGFLMFDDSGAARMTDRDKRKALSLVVSGEMPKGKKLTAEEKKQIADLLK